MEVKTNQTLTLCGNRNGHQTLGAQNVNTHNRSDLPYFLDDKQSEDTNGVVKNRNLTKGRRQNGKQ